MSVYTSYRRRWLYRQFDGFVGRGEGGVFWLLGQFLPDTSVIHSRRLQHLLFAKGLSDTARDSTKYAAVVAVVSSTGSAFQSSLMSVASLLPSALFGLYAGEVADSMPKRLAIASAYALGALACFTIPTAFGTNTAPMFALVFMLTAFAQLASPAESSAIPLVANDRQLATAASLMGLASSIGTGFGTALLAPLLFKLTSAEVVFYVAGVLMFAAMTRVLHVYSPRDVQRADLKLRPSFGANGRVLRWLFRHPSVATMVGVSVLAGISNVIMASLAPVYVQDVLNSDPANTVYVMGPSGIAMTISIMLVPLFVRQIGERLTAAIGFGLVVTALVLLGLVGRDLAVVIDPVNPLRVTGLVGLEIATDIRTAALLSFPLGLGVGLTDNSVKTYINRRVPLQFQGRTFAARNTLESTIAIVPLLTVASIASFVGVSAVLLSTPLVIYVLLLFLLRVSRHYGTEPIDPRTMVTQTFWEESEEPFAEMETPARA